jgi:hypothetical protein
MQPLNNSNLNNTHIDNKPSPKVTIDNLIKLTEKLTEDNLILTKPSQDLKIFGYETLPFQEIQISNKPTFDDKWEAHKEAYKKKNPTEAEQRNLPSAKEEFRDIANFLQIFNNFEHNEASLNELNEARNKVLNFQSKELNEKYLSPYKMFKQELKGIEFNENNRDASIKECHKICVKHVLEFLPEQHFAFEGVMHYVINKSVNKKGDSKMKVFLAVYRDSLPGFSGTEYKAGSILSVVAVVRSSDGKYLLGKRGVAGCEFDEEQGVYKKNETGDYIPKTNAKLMPPAGAVDVCKASEIQEHLAMLQAKIDNKEDMNKYFGNILVENALKEGSEEYSPKAIESIKSATILGTVDDNPHANVKKIKSATDDVKTREAVNIKVGYVILQSNLNAKELQAEYHKEKGEDHLEILNPKFYSLKDVETFHKNNEIHPSLSDLYPLIAGHEETLGVSR